MYNNYFFFRRLMSLYFVDLNETGKWYVIVGQHPLLPGLAALSSER